MIAPSIGSALTAIVRLHYLDTELNSNLEADLIFAGSFLFFWQETLGDSCLPRLRG